MASVRLTQLDGALPNLALMKLAHWHRAKGDSVTLTRQIARPMFRAKRFGALGIHGVMTWAKDGRDRPSFEEEEESCSGLFGCGT